MLSNLDTLKAGWFTVKAQLSAQHMQSRFNRLFWSVLEELIFLSTPKPLSGAAICQAVWWDKYSERNKSGTPMEKGERTITEGGL